MAGQNLIRIAALALGLSTLSFAAGVAGDLSSIDPPRSGQRVVLRIPPEIPADTPRAHPLLSTSSAEAAPVSAVRRARHAERQRLVEAVQIAHEQPFGLSPIAFETETRGPQKPFVDPRVKPEREVLPEPYATKVA
ncbi:MAG: hypothetical protein R3C31_03430 [Hyphomonadaceae bacterium]